LFVLEDLADIRSASERVKGKSRYFNVSWPYYDLEQKIIYKAALRGQMVIKVDPAYTSQTCPVCGRRDRASRDKSKHLFRCTGCGYTSNDDRIAAMNLHSMGIEYLVQCGKSISLSAGAASTVPDVTPASETDVLDVTNAGGESRVLQGSHKPPLLQAVGS
jgi:transposase